MRICIFKSMRRLSLLANEKFSCFAGARSSNQQYVNASNEVLLLTRCCGCTWQLNAKWFTVDGMLIQQSSITQSCWIYGIFSRNFVPKARHAYVLAQKQKCLQNWLVRKNNGLLDNSWSIVFNPLESYTTYYHEKKMKIEFYLNSTSIPRALDVLSTARMVLWKDFFVLFLGGLYTCIRRFPLANTTFFHASYPVAILLSPHFAGSWTK